MQTTQLYKYILFFAGIFLVNACQEDDLKEPHGVNITFQAVTGLKSTADTLILEEAYIGLGSIDFKRDGEGDSVTVEKIVYNGPYVVDLLNGTASPAIKWIFAEPGFYRAIDLTTFNALAQGKTINLKGTVMPAGGQEEIPFEFVSSRNYTLEIKNNPGITIREGEDLDVLVVFDLSDLFRGVNLNELQKNEQGVVVISEEEDLPAVTSLLNTFEAFSSFGINDGLPLPEPEDQNPVDEIPGDVENPDEEDGEGSAGDENDDNPDDNPDEEDGNENDEPESGSEDEQDDNSSGDDASDSEDEGEGATEEDDDDGNNGDGYPGAGNGGTPPEDDEDNSGDDDEENPDDETAGEGSGSEPGSDQDGQDDGNESHEEDNSDGDNGQDDNDDGDEEDGEDDDDGDDEDGEDDDDGDDEDGEDDDDRDEEDGDDNDDEEDDDREDDDDEEEDDKGKDNNPGNGNDKNKDKGNRGKGNN